MAKDGGVRERSRRGERIDAHGAKAGALEVNELRESAVGARDALESRGEASLTGRADLGESLLAVVTVQGLSPRRSPERC